jgi:hypothetical protein
VEQLLAQALGRGRGEGAGREGKEGGLGGRRKSPRHAFSLWVSVTSHFA